MQVLSIGELHLLRFVIVKMTQSITRIGRVRFSANFNAEFCNPQYNSKICYIAGFRVLSVLKV